MRLVFVQGFRQLVPAGTQVKLTYLPEMKYAAAKGLVIQSRYGGPFFLESVADGDGDPMLKGGPVPLEIFDLGRPPFTLALGPIHVILPIDFAIANTSGNAAELQMVVALEERE